MKAIVKNVNLCVPYTIEPDPKIVVGVAVSGWLACRKQK